MASPSPRESLGFSLAVFEFGAHGSSLSTRSTGRSAHLHGFLPPILSANGYDLAHLLWYVYRDLRWPRSFEQNFRITKWIVGRGLSCRAKRQRVEVGLIWGAAVKGCVRSPCVVEGEVTAD